MNIAQKLSIYREHRGWSAGFVAEKLEISLEKYNELESGFLQITPSFAQKLSFIYNTPEAIWLEEPTCFLTADVLYNNCYFQGSGANGYINNNNNQGSVLLTALKEYEAGELKKEVTRLEKLNEKLTDLVTRQALFIMNFAHQA